MLKLATFGLSIPLIIRGINDLWSKMSDSYHALIMTHNTTFEWVFYVFCELIPLCFQLSSLVFGYIRKNRV